MWGGRFGCEIGGDRPVEDPMREGGGSWIDLLYALLLWDE